MESSPLIQKGVLMKYLLITSLGLFTIGSFAQDDFSSKKQMKLEYLDQKIELLQQSRSCIQEANNKSGLKECKDQMKAQKQELKEKKRDWKQQREESKDKAKEGNASIDEIYESDVE